MQLLPQARCLPLPELVSITLQLLSIYEQHTMVGNFKIMFDIMLNYFRILKPEWMLGNLIENPLRLLSDEANFYLGELFVCNVSSVDT